MTKDVKKLNYRENMHIYYSTKLLIDKLKDDYS
jgi:hypothetical protein